MFNKILPLSSWGINRIQYISLQTVWYYPNEVYGDKELLTKTKYIKSDSDFGKAPSIALFTGSKCLIRRSDGALVTVATSPYPLMLYDLTASGQWDKATRLCRFIKVGNMEPKALCLRIHTWTVQIPQTHWGPGILRVKPWL